MDRPLTHPQTLLAVAACIVAALSLSSMDTVMKYIMAQGVSPWFAQGARGWLILMGVVLLMLIQSKGKADFRLIRPGAPLMWLRGLFMFVSSILIFIAIAEIDQATVTTMIFLYPLLVGLLGVLLFGETIGPRRIVFIVMGFAGVVTAAGFSPSTFQFWAVLPAIGAVFISFQGVMVRWAPKEMTNLELTFATSVGMAVCGTPFLFTHFSAAVTWELWWAFALVGVLGASGSFNLSFAFKHAPMGLVGSLNYSSVIFSTLLAWYFFNEVPGSRIFVAMALIIGSGIAYMWFQHQADVANRKS